MPTRPREMQIAVVRVVRPAFYDVQHAAKADPTGNARTGQFVPGTAVQKIHPVTKLDVVK